MARFPLCKAAFVIVLATLPFPGIASKPDDPLAEALARNKTLTDANTALVRQIAAAHGDSAAASAVMGADASLARQAVSDQKEAEIRLEIKAEEARASAASAARSGELGNALIFMFGTLSVIVPAFMGYLRDERMHKWQTKQSDAIDVVKEQTNGMVDKMARLADAAGHSRGVMEERGENTKH